MPVRHVRNGSLLTTTKRGIVGHTRSHSLSKDNNFQFRRQQQQVASARNNFPAHEVFISESITLPNSHPNSTIQPLTARSTKYRREKQKNMKALKEKLRAEDQLKEKSKNKRRTMPKNQAIKSGEKDSLEHSPNSKNRPGNKSKPKEHQEWQEKALNLQKPQSGKINPKKADSNEQDNWQLICDIYQPYLTPEQVLEIKDHKHIYFFGKIKDRAADSSKKSSTNTFEVNSSPVKGVAEHTDSVEQTEDEFYQYELGDHIAFRYEIISLINRGSFGEVLKVFDHKNKEYLALKIVKKSQQLVQQTFIEISILTHIKEKDRTGLNGIVRIKDFTIFRNHICILFELLDGNLYELIQANNYVGLCDEVIRIFAVQILNSLNFLQREGIIHCDIKPENVVMRNWGKSGIKIIDFGTSCFQGKQIYQYLQSRYYRAPEIILRTPYSFPIDMWSLGCLLAELKLGQPIFAGSSNIQQLTYIVNSIGTPKKKDGIFSNAFLQNEEIDRLISDRYVQNYHEMKLTNDIPLVFANFKYHNICMVPLEDRLKECKKYDQDFYRFLLKILVWEPSQRLTPAQALQDSWILKGLPTEIKELYTVFNSVQLIKNSSTKKASKEKGNKHGTHGSLSKEGKKRKESTVFESTSKKDHAKITLRNKEESSSPLQKRSKPSRQLQRDQGVSN